MAQTIKLKRSATQNAVPSTSSLALGEIALNTYDGKLFIKKDVGGTESIVTIGAVGAGSIGPSELASTAVTAGSYGSTSAIPVITVDADGRITSASTATISGLSANSVTSTEIAANAVGISELNVSDGTDGQVLTTDGSGTLTFETPTGGAASANAFATNTASGNGSTATFTLSSTPSAESKIIAFINGVFQNQDAYTISGTDITFDTAPIAGTNNVVVYVIGDVYSGESVLISNFNGNGSTTAFTLSNNPGNENNTQVYIDGVYQQKTTYSVSGTTLTFSSAPPTGTANIEVVMLTSTTVNTPAAGSVVTASMADDSVTGAKLVSSAVTTAKIADANVTTAKIADANVTTAKIANDAVTLDKIADAVFVTESEGISSNDNDTTLPTSAAVKDYVDGKDFETGLAGDSGTGTVNTSQTLTVSGTANEVNTSVSGQTVTVGLPDSVSLTSNLTVGGYIAGPASFTIDPAGVGDNTGTVVIAGNLQVDGTQTIINSTSMSVDDLNLTLASGAADAAAANGAGLTIDGASATLLYASSGDKFVFNKGLDVTGNIGVTGTVDGVDIAARDAVLTSTTTTAGAALPKAGGTMTGNITLGNNNKAIFGAGSDLQIYHDGSNSYIKDAGTGHLKIVAGNFYVNNAADNQNMIAAINGGATSIMYSGGTKLATTSSGVDVTGTATMDGLTVDGNATIDGGSSANTVLTLDSSTANTYLKITDSNSTNGTFIGATTNDLNFYPNNVLSAKFSAGGDISFYEDTGSTAKLFWDASAEHLRVGSTSAIFTNSVISGVSALGPTIGAKQTVAAQSAGGFWNSDTGTVNLVNFYAGTSGNQVGSIAGTSTGVSLFGTGGTGLTVYGASGKVGIGTTTPQKKFHIEHTAGASEGILISGASDTAGHTAGILLRAEGGEADSALRAKAGIFLERTATYGIGKLHIANRHNSDNTSATISDANITIYDDKVGIGTTSPDEKLHVAGQVSFEVAGNTNRGNIIIGEHGNGTSKWATLAATHYNDATGSGNGSGAAGNMVIGSFSDATANNIYIGGGPYELNPATHINFSTHSSNTHNLGGTVRMTINSSGNVAMSGALAVTGTLSSGPITVNSDANSSLQIKDGGTNAIQMLAAVGDELYLGGNNTYALRFLGNGTNDVVFDNSSKVGIGTASPNEALEVSGNIQFTTSVGTTSARPAVTAATLANGEIRAKNSDTGDGGFLRLSAGGGTNTNQVSYIDIQGYSNNTGTGPKSVIIGTQGTDRVIINGTGQLLLNPLGVSTPSIAFTNDTNTGITRPTSDTLQIVTGSEERIRFNSTGALLPDGPTAVEQTRPFFGGANASSYSDSTNLAYDKSDDQYSITGEHLKARVRARAYTKYVHMKTNLSADNQMFFFRIYGYFYNNGVNESIRGGYTYNGGVISESVQNAYTSNSNYTIGDFYRSSTGNFLCVRLDVHHTSYTEGEALVFFGSHSNTVTRELQITNMQHRDDGNNAY
jgi:hypothetical protein